MKNNIREIRKRKGMEAEALAKTIGMSRAQLSRIETGKRTLNDRWIPKIAEALDVDPSDLISQTDDTKLTKFGLVDIIDWNFIRLHLAGQTEVKIVDRIPVDACVSHENCECFGIIAQDDSIEKVGKKGSIIIIDPAQKALIHERFYMFDIDGELLLRRYLGDTHPRLITWNSAISLDSMKTIFLDEPPVVIGRIVRSMQKL